MMSFDPFRNSILKFLQETNFVKLDLNKRILMFSINTKFEAEKEIDI